MKSNDTVLRRLVTALVAIGFVASLAAMAQAHCDTMSGPVIADAKAALEKGDVTATLKWVTSASEPQIRSAFAKAQAVRGKGPEARELADHYFLETLVRIHRAGEGAPYTGIKDEPAEPIVAMADKALEDGSVDAMVAAISGHMTAAVKEKFHKVLEARKSKDKSVEAGREFVAAYVTYMHFVEGIHTAIESAGEHHGAGGESEAAPAHDQHRN